ncbi:DUF418 domain-containing protein [Streptosporangium carneum]|uniref:DUF418 domain-containing protein n=1 Tax=Streptosporangium carneum TaxID=47481 RepID=A0A9W6I7J4_9ACTN|nr:DUF418 domain-containing protein [Streptosporangium carneum]GLK13531.1 hypothetical protein GCM10017600_69420 [Streptosporangium carneum]
MVDGEQLGTVRTTAPAQPRRIAAVDALRGFALFGIVVVNIAYLASGYRMAGLAEPAFSAPLDQEVRWVVTMFFENKFYLLFSFLFGYSLTLQVDSAANSGAAFVPRFLRRLAGLFLLGLAHAVLLFPGDILATYAVVGLVLLAVRGIRPRTAVVAAVGLTMMLAMGFVLLAGLALLGADASGTVAGGTVEAARSDAALQSSVSMIVSEHLHKLGKIVVLRVFFQGPAVLAACLIGLAVGKKRLLADLSGHTAALRRLQWAGFTIGGAGAFVYAHSTWSGGGSAYHMLGQAVDLLTAPLLAAAYAATLLRLLPSMPRLTAVLTPPGRIALTNYLAQSLICSLIFTGYGLGLVDRLSPLVVSSIAVAIFAVQAAYSAVWLRGHRYGPVEWLLRWLTNWRRPAAAPSSAPKLRPSRST